MASSPLLSSSPARTPNDSAEDPYRDDPRLSPLEAEVLNEYRRLRENLDEVRAPFPRGRSQTRSQTCLRSIAVRDTRNPGRYTLVADLGWAEDAGAQDGAGVHRAQEQRVRDRAAAAD